MYSITLKAYRVINQGDGHFTVFVESTEPSEELLKVARENFPHTQDKLWELIAIENLIVSMRPDYTLPKEPTFPYPQDVDVEPVKATSPKY